MSEGDERAEAQTAPDRETGKPASKKKRRFELRFSALLMGVPLVLFFVLPWDPNHALSPAIRAPLLTMGVAGAVLVVLGLSPHRVRKSGVPFAGGLLFGIGLWLLGALVVSGTLKSAISHLPRALVALWIVLPVAAMGAEMAMHRHPRSRRLTAIALVAWLAVVAVVFLPHGPTIAWSSTPVGHLVRAFERERFHLHADYWLPFVASFIGLIGVVQCLRRLGADRERAARRRFRSSALAWLLVPIPTLGLTTWMIVDSALHHPSWTTKHFYVGFGILGPVLGGALAFQALLSTKRARAGSLKPFAVIATSLLAVGLGVAFYPPHASDDDAEVVSLANEVGDAVAAGLRGEPVERRYLGNYSALDLRGAGGLELPDGARLTHVGVRVEAATDGQSHRGYALVDEEGELGWVALDDREVVPELEPDDVPDWLLGEGETAGPTVWDRVPERFGASGCRPSPESIPAVLHDHLRHRRRACNPLHLRALRGPRYVTGSVTGYVVVFSNGTESVAFGGDLNTRRSGAWIGVPRPIEDYPPPQHLYKWVDDID